MTMGNDTSWKYSETWANDHLYKTTTCLNKPSVFSTLRFTYLLNTFIFSNTTACLVWIMITNFRPRKSFTWICICIQRPLIVTSAKEPGNYLLQTQSKSQWSALVICFMKHWYHSQVIKIYSAKHFAQVSQGDLWSWLGPVCHICHSFRSAMSGLAHKQ